MSPDSGSRPDGLGDLTVETDILSAESDVHHSKQWPDLLQFLAGSGAYPDFRDPELAKRGFCRRKATAPRPPPWVQASDVTRSKTTSRDVVSSVVHLVRKVSDRVLHFTDAGSGTDRRRAVEAVQGRYRHCRVKVGDCVKSLYCQLLVIAAIITDVAVLLLGDTVGESAALTVEWCVLIILSVEAMGRIFYEGRRFLYSWLNYVETLLVFFSWVEAIILSELVDKMTGVEASMPVLRFIRPVSRTARVLRVAVRTYRATAMLARSLRRLESGARKRFVDGTFDLDLAYVVADRVIVMGVPDVGVSALYRNPVNKVAQFFNERHTNAYLIFNVTQERHYPTEAFFWACCRLPGSTIPSGSDGCRVARFLRSMPGVSFGFSHARRGSAFVCGNRPQRAFRCGSADFHWCVLQSKFGGGVASREAL
mmetsp:Transcript_47687/g.126095  ORF Transcript_47687/g.126095 Transcript_47687/m.126095 type:complete len:423 (-) Transcript_47687:3324-4592(-)